MSAPTQPAAADPRLAPALAVLEEAIARRAFPGGAFGVLSGGTAILGSAGRFTYAPDSPAVTPATVYDLASLTKVVATTTMAMLLREWRILDLDLPLGELLPGFLIGRSDAEDRRRARQVTVRMLLAHTSGLPAYARLFAGASTPGALLRACLEMPFENAPGEAAVYSDIGFILLGKALEVAAGRGLDRFFSAQVASPLGLAHTRFRPPAAEAAAIAPSEEDVSLRHRVLAGEVQDENAFVLGGVAGHAGLFGNAGDLLAYSASLLGEAEAPRLVAESTLALFAERQPPPGSSRALGWDTPSQPSSSGRHFGAGSIGHLGYSGTSLWIDLRRRLAVVLLTNRTWPDRSSNLIREVRPRFHDALLEGLGLDR